MGGGGRPTALVGYATGGEEERQYRCTQDKSGIGSSPLSCYEQKVITQFCPSGFSPAEIRMRDSVDWLWSSGRWGGILL